jgi:hypothetical protein
MLPVVLPAVLRVAPSAVLPVVVLVVAPWGLLEVALRVLLLEASRLPVLGVVPLEAHQLLVPEVVRLLLVPEVVLPLDPWALGLVVLPVEPTSVLGPAPPNPLGTA